MIRQLVRWSVLPLLPLLVPLVACGNQMDTVAVEDRIKADIERQGRRLSLREVRCPAGVTRQAGAFFRCVGELEPEGTFTINVTQQDNQGTVTWEVPNSKVMLNLAKVEERLQQGLSEALGQPSLVDCGEAIYRANQPGDQFECRVVGGLTDGTDRIHAIWVKVDATGNLDWQELRDSRSMATERPQARPSSTSPSRAAASDLPASDGMTTPRSSKANPSSAPSPPGGTQY